MTSDEWRYCPEHWTRTLHVNVSDDPVLPNWVCSLCLEKDVKDEMNRRAMYDRATRSSVHQSP